MKLILEVDNPLGIDSYLSYHSFECESKELAEIQLLELCEKHRLQNNYEPIIFYEHEIGWGGFYNRIEKTAKKSGRVTEINWKYIEPKIFTLEELFEYFKS